MTEQEFRAWTEETARSTHHWRSDVIRESRGEYLFYRGGKNGRYIKIDQTGRLTMGDYEGAIPHIGEASFTISFEKQFEDRESAVKRILEAGGASFLLEITGLIQ